MLFGTDGPRIFFLLPSALLTHLTYLLAIWGCFLGSSCLLLYRKIWTINIPYTIMYLQWQRVQETFRTFQKKPVMTFIAGNFEGLTISCFYNRNLTKPQPAQHHSGLVLLFESSRTMPAAKIFQAEEEMLSPAWIQWVGWLQRLVGFFVVKPTLLIKKRQETEKDNAFL